jgi:hypothetical protein
MRCIGQPVDAAGGRRRETLRVGQDGSIRSDAALPDFRRQLKIAQAGC